MVDQAIRMDLKAGSGWEFTFEAYIGFTLVQCYARHKVMVTPHTCGSGNGQIRSELYCFNCGIGKLEHINQGKRTMLLASNEG